MIGVKLSDGTQVGMATDDYIFIDTVNADEPCNINIIVLPELIKALQSLIQQ